MRGAHHRFYKNVFTVTLQTNVNLAHADASMIEMTGLEYAIGPLRCVGRQNIPVY